MADSPAAPLAHITPLGEAIAKGDDASIVAAINAAAARDTKPTPVPVNAPATDGPARLYLGREEILAADDVRYQDVPVDEWRRGAFVRVRTVTASDKDRLEIAMLRSDTRIADDEVRARFIAMCVVDEAGNPLFEAADIPKLKTKAAAPIDRIWDAVQKLNAVTDQDVQVMAGNSGAARTGT